MATKKSLEAAVKGWAAEEADTATVKTEVKEAETEAKTGDVKTTKQTDIGTWREEQARLSNTGDSQPTNTRRSHPPA